MEEKDPWLAPDKVYHVLFCFTLSIVFTTLANFTRYPFLRRHAIWIGSIASLLAGAAKEAADELGYFRSAGASARDAVADVVGDEALLMTPRSAWSSADEDDELCWEKNASHVSLYSLGSI